MGIIKIFQRLHKIIHSEGEHTMTEKPQDKKLLDPDTNEVNISTRRDARFYIFLAKIILKKFNSIELKALGQAADICVRVAENLERYNYAKISKISSETINLQDSNRNRKGARFIVKLDKSEEFDKLTENFLK